MGRRIGQQVWQTSPMGWGKRWFDTARHPARPDGAVALALFALPWFAELAPVFHHHHHLDLDVATLTLLFAVSLPAPAAWLAWAAFRDARRFSVPGSNLSMADVADQLAVVVGEQWANEAALRRLNDPYPLPVAWVAADKALTDSWNSLLKLTAGGAGWPPPSDVSAWAAGPDDLAGGGGELAEILARVPTGRLVVLGEPGAGKTMLMVRLVLDLLTRRAAGAPVPFLVSVASWNASDQDLRSWLADRLLIDHPALAALAGSTARSATQAAALLASGLIMPILDGLDEIPEQVRSSAVSRINDALRPGEQVVVTCRSKEYRAAVPPDNGAEVILRAAAAVQLRPLDADTVRSYLCDDAAGPAARARWAPVLAVLGTAAPAGQALRTPLMVGLARAIYNPRPGELAGSLRDPAELCAPADREAVESLLFDAFIPAAYRHDSHGRWKVQDAERWLMFLGSHLECTINSGDFAWWQLQMAVSRRAVGLVVGLVAGLATGLTAGLVAGLSLGLVVGLGARPAFGSVEAPARGVRMTTRGFVVGLVTGLGFGLWWRLLAGLMFGLTAGLAAGLVAGLVAGLAVGLAAGMVRTVWPSYMITRGWLAFRRQLPWSLMSFLSDAHQRGILRQAGGVYQLRHLELQHRLAARSGKLPGDVP
jgi:hypothetical protein